MLTSLRPTYYLGIDAGGTHTEAVIANESGYIIGRGLSGGANLHNIDFEKACDHLCAAVAKAREEAKNKRNLEDLAFETTCIGMAGLDTDKDFSSVTKLFNSHLGLEKLQTKQVLFTNDGLIGLKSGTESNFGICLVAGTGSNCYGLARNGHTAKAGDWGYILGDQSSSFSIGKAILEEVMKEYDGRKAVTTLTAKVLEYLHLNQASDIVSWVYQSRIPVKEVAQLSLIASDPVLSIHPVVSREVYRAAEAMVDAYDAIFHRLKLSTDEPIPIVLIGGLFTLTDTFENVVIGGIKQRTPNADIIKPKRTPAEGAIRIAMMGNYLNVLPDAIVNICHNP